MAPDGRPRLGGGATLALGLAAAALYAAPAFVAPSAGAKRHLGQQVDVRPTSLGRAQTARPITSAGAREEQSNSFSLGCRAVGAALIAFVCASAKRNGARKSFSVVQRRIVPSSGYRCKHKKLRTTMRWGGIPSWTKKPLLKRDLYRPWKLHVPKLLSQQRVTRWGRILIEKRRIAFHYNVQDRVLRKCMTEVMRNSDLTPHEYPVDKWFGVLESRLDNFLWRVGVAPTMATARYMITRGCVQIQRYNWDETNLNKRRRTAAKEDTDDPLWIRPNIPGCRLKIGDKVRISRKDPRHMAFCKTWMEETGKALAEAKSAVADSTGAADSLVYGSSQVSFLQEASSDKAKALERTSEGSGLSSHADLAHFEAVRFVRDLARRQNSSDLSLLAKRMASAMRLSGGVSEDPFSKVKGLIQDMIEKLEREAGADSKHKAYCDKEISVTDQKQADKSDETGKLSTKMDRLTVREAQLKEEVADIEKSLAGLATVQADMDRIREEENAVFVTNKADLVKGLGGAKLALKILTEYYAKDGKAHNAAQGAGEGVIGLLEVCESDLSKGLAELLGAEESAKSEYDQASKDNAIQQKTKEADVKYKSKEAKDFAKSLAEVKSDRASVQTELDAVGKYLETLHSQCDEKTETYEEQARRRTAEVAGLREALEILEGEAALLQRESRRRPLLRVAKLQRPPPHKQDHIVLYTVANSLESS